MKGGGIVGSGFLARGVVYSKSNHCSHADVGKHARTRRSYYRNLSKSYLHFTLSFCKDV